MQILALHTIEDQISLAEDIAEAEAAEADDFISRL